MSVCKKGHTYILSVGASLACATVPMASACLLEGDQSLCASTTSVSLCVCVCVYTCVCMCDTFVYCVCTMYVREREIYLRHDWLAGWLAKEES